MTRTGQKDVMIVLPAGDEPMAVEMRQSTLPLLPLDQVEAIAADFVDACSQVTPDTSQRIWSHPRPKDWLGAKLAECDPDSRVQVVAKIWEMKLQIEKQLTTGRKSRTRQATRSMTSAQPEPAIELSPLARALLPRLPIPVIREPRDVLHPEIVEPVFKRGDTKNLTLAIASLPDGKPRQLVFDALLSQGIELAQRKPMGPRQIEGSVHPRKISRVVRALAAIDDSVDEAAAAGPGERPKAHRYLRRSLAKLSRNDPEKYTSLIRSLPIPVLLDKLGGISSEIWSKEQLVAGIRRISNELLRGEQQDRSIVRNRAVAGTRVDPKQRSRVDFRIDQAFWEEIRAEEDSRLLGLLGQILDAVMERDQEASAPFGEHRTDFGIAEAIFSSLLGSDKTADMPYTLRPIIALAESGHEAALEVLKLDLTTAPIVARLEGIAYEDFAQAFFAQGDLLNDEE